MFSSVQLDYVLEENCLKQEKEGKTQPNNLLKIVSWQINPYHLAWVHSRVSRVVQLKPHVCKKLHK